MKIRKEMFGPDVRYAVIPAVFRRAREFKASTAEHLQGCRYIIDFEDGTKSVFVFKYGQPECYFEETAKGRFLDTMQALRKDIDLKRCYGLLKAQEHTTQVHNFMTLRAIYRNPNIGNSTYRLFDLDMVYGAASVA